MRTLKSKLLVVCIVVGWLALMGSSIQTADAAKWSFHFTYPNCPGGHLYVWATKDCRRQLLLFKGYAKNCEKYVGHVPGAPYNDLIFDFFWDYNCGNHDHIKIALPTHNAASGQWELQELPPWIDAHVAGEIPPIISVGDPTGNIQRVYIVVDPNVWRDNYSGVVLDEYKITNGKCDDLPGYLIGTTPITFDPTAPEDGNPFSTTPLTGTLYLDGEIELLPDPPVPPPPVFEQLHWEGPFDPEPESSWGRVRLEINQPRGFYFLNLSVETSGDGNPTPVIENMSIETTGERMTIDSFFDIFEKQNQAPHPVSLLYYLYSITEEPQQEPPTGQLMAAEVTPVRYRVGGEEEYLVIGDLPRVHTGATLCPIKKSGQLPNLGAFVNQAQNLNECAPAAISNSLKYLQATGGVDATWDTDIGTVGDQIGFTSAGGTPASWYQKKQSLPYFTQHVTTRYITPPLTDAKLADLVNELNRGQDIEMDLKGHVEVLVGLRERCDGSIELDLFHDNQTDGPVVDPMHTSVVDESVVPPRVDGMELERFVIECPIEDEPELPEVFLPYVFLDTYEDWVLALQNGVVRAMTQTEGEAYMTQLQEFHKEGDPYPYDPVTNPFVEPFPPLYVHPGGGGGGGAYGDPNLDPCDAGLVMGWGSQDGDSSSAWVLKYDQDPDLTNCIITLVVTAPQWAMSSPGSQINKVSFGMGNPLTGTGPVRSWNWACGATSTPATPIAWNTATTITIDTSKTGTTAATPTATGYANNPAFMLNNVTWLSVDENGTWVGGASSMPGPGGFQFLWNYWHWILVTPKTTVEKGIYKKWSQPPVVLDPNADPPVIQGWDEHSNFNMPVVADDWQCDDDRPVTDIHWWGSYFKDDAAGGGRIPWTQPIPPALPRAFHIGIWTNVPDPNVDDPLTYSRPDLLIWENYCDNFVWNFAGYDRDPRKLENNPGLPTEPGHDEPMDATFQFTQLLSQDEWFYQEPSDDPDNPTIYWLSIAPIWGDDEPEWEWGWKTRLPKWNDDAVSIEQATPWWWPVVGSTKWVSGVPVQHPPYPVPHGDFTSWDVAFELTTNEGLSADLHPDGIVNFKDFAILADQWLETIP